VLKIDLSKAYDRVSWLYLRMLLSHLGFDLPFTNWIMSCISTVSFVVLINGVASSFFTVARGLRQGCPLSPLLFLLVAEGLSRAIIEAKSRGEFIGVSLSPTLRLSHLLFVDDVLIFCSGLRQDAEKLRSILDLFSRATGMQINGQKSTLSAHLMEDAGGRSLQGIFPF
jgi:hypothetical protein